MGEFSDFIITCNYTGSGLFFVDRQSTNRKQISKKQKQSPNFIYDITDCPIEDDKIEKQINGIFRSRHTKFVERIVIIKDGKVLKVYRK